MARWRRKLSALPSPASCLRAGSRGQRGRDEDGASARALAAPRSPSSAQGKGTGLTAASPTASAASNDPSGTRPPRCQHHSQALQPHGDPARSQPLGDLAKLLGRGKRVPEYLHPPLRHRQPTLLPPISTGQLFYLTPLPAPSLQKIIIGPSHHTKGLKVVNSISKGFVMLVFPRLLHKAISTVPLRQLLSGCLLEVIGFFRSLFKIRNPAS